MSSLLLKYSLYSSILNILFTPFSSGVARIFGYITIILFFAGAIASSVVRYKLILHKTVFYMLLAILAAFLVSLPSLQISHVTDLIDKATSILSFVAFYITLSIKFSDDGPLVLENIFHANYVLCAIFIAFTFGPFDFKYEIVNKYGDKIFTMGLGNPNGVALCVLFSIVILMIQFNRLVEFYSKIINLATVLTLFYILFLLSSRTVLVCALIVIFAFLFRAIRFFKWISYFIIAAPILMIGLQLGLMNSNNNEMIQILGKAIDTGRPEMYADILQDILSSPVKIIFGDLCKNAFYNYHNGILTIFSSIGLCGVVLYMIFWHKQLKSLRTLCVEKSQKIAFVAIIAIIVHSSAESMGVIGTIPYCIFVAIIMRIARGEIISRHDRVTTDRI